MSYYHWLGDEAEYISPPMTAEERKELRAAAERAGLKVLDWDPDYFIASVLERAGSPFDPRI